MQNLVPILVMVTILFMMTFLIMVIIPEYREIGRRLVSQRVTETEVFRPN